MYKTISMTFLLRHVSEVKKFINLGFIILVESGGETIFEIKQPQPQKPDINTKLPQLNLGKPNTSNTYRRVDIYNDHLEHNTDTSNLVRESSKIAYKSTKTNKNIRGAKPSKRSK